MRFHSPTPSSTLLSPRLSHGGIRGLLPPLALLSLVSYWVFLFLGPSRGAVTCAWYLSSCCFSCYPLLPNCPYCAWRVWLLFIVVSCLLISLWSLAIVFMAPRPFCLRSFFDVLAFPPVVPPGWSPLGFPYGCSGFSFPLSFCSVCVPGYGAFLFPPTFFPCFLTWCCSFFPLGFPFRSLSLCLSLPFSSTGSSVFLAVCFLGVLFLGGWWGWRF